MKKKFNIYVKRKDFYHELSKEFFTYDNVTVCTVKIGIPITSLPALSMLVLSKKELKKLANRFPRLVPDSKGYLICSFTGTAKCKEDDVYDERVGKNVADAKVEMKIYDFMRRLLNFLKEMIANKAYLYAEATKYFSVCYNREKNFVERV